MTENSTPRQFLLDALVYAPAGLVLTVVDELPKLAAKGRDRIENQVTMARMMGRFTVQFARRQAENRFEALRDRTAEHRGPTADRAAPTASNRPVPMPAAGTSAAGTPTAGEPSRQARPSRAVGAPRPADGVMAAREANGGGSTRRTVRTGQGAGAPAPIDADAGRRTARAVTPGSAGSVDGSSPLGIPGYDSLSASQVVQRLAGLDPTELRLVREHEAGGRHRRTILNRVEQLLGANATGAAGDAGTAGDAGAAGDAGMAGDAGRAGDAGATGADGGASDDASGARG